MKLLRQAIRRLITESSEHVCDDFILELDKRFRKTVNRHQYENYVKDFPDGCEVHFQMEALEYTNVYFLGVETVGDDCVKKGYARDTLQSIFDLADEMGIWILGTVEPFEPTEGSGDRPDEQELINFYRSMGVKIVDGTDLERAPQKPKSSTRLPHLAAK